MEFRQLFTFKKIVELRSFTKAADSLGYSQPTVTSHIHALEEHLGVKLFDRIGRKVVLTNAGEQLLIYVSKITEMYKQIEAMSDNEDTIKGNIKIGAPETLTIYGLEPILQEFRRLFPQVSIVLVNDSNAPMYEKLNSGEIDMAFQITPDCKSKDYVVIHLEDERFVLVANPDCKINSLESNPDQILDECVIYNAKGCIYRVAFENYLKSRHIIPRNLIELWSVEAIKRAVINGLGISMLPFISVKKDIEEGKLKVIDVHLQLDNVSIQLIYHKNKWLSQAMRAWIDVTQKTWESRTAKTRI
jgi:DNA-binding transcriptional LysR family regulator